MSDHHCCESGGATIRPPSARVPSLARRFLRIIGLIVPSTIFGAFAKMPCLFRSIYSNTNRNQPIVFQRKLSAANPDDPLCCRVVIPYSKVSGQLCHLCTLDQNIAMRCWLVTALTKCRRVTYCPRQ